MIALSGLASTVSAGEDLLWRLITCMLQIHDGVVRYRGLFEETVFVIGVVRYHRRLRNVRVDRLLLHARHVGLQLLLEWFDTECRGDHVAWMVSAKVVGPVDLLIDGDLLAQDLVTDLPNDVPI